MKLGLLGTLKLLIRALGVFASHQAAIANELKILNKHIERIYPPAKETSAPQAEDPLLGDDPYTLAMAADAEMTLRHELGRDATSEEILARMRIWNERRDPMPARQKILDVL